SNGTDLNAPLALAYNKLVSSSDKNNPAEQVKVLILVTDGENFGEQNPNEWLKKFKKSEITLFILGVGTELGGKIPTETGFKKDHFGKPIVSTLNSAKMKEMSELSGGEYFEITDETNDIKTMVNKMLEVEGTMKGSRKIDSVANKYFYFLFIAIIFLILDVLISVKTIRI
ncbi:MAG TPA: vWA domain-containing protein, partial [Cytophagaceae bacterium]|nr:vWA domain-containing protein [Cytophagaceae bacterium]